MPMRWGAIEDHFSLPLNRFSFLEPLFLVECQHTGHPQWLTPHTHTQCVVVVCVCIERERGDGEEGKNQWHKRTATERRSCALDGFDRGGENPPPDLFFFFSSLNDDILSTVVMTTVPPYTHTRFSPDAAYTQSTQKCDHSFFFNRLAMWGFVSIVVEWYDLYRARHFLFFLT